jgi:endonuclease/exonuclease/phosphatase family metal-dependent hydrolase
MSQDPITAPDSQEDPTDLTSWGHALSFKKPPHSMRLICQNPYGLDASTNYRKMDLFARNMAAYQVDIGCLPETNADWKQPDVLQQCHSALRKHLKHHRLITSCSDAVARHSYLSGGTATIAANNWTGRIASSGTDSHGLGRWSYVRVKGKNERRLLVITVYQVCKGSIGTAGDTTNFSHQWHILRARGDEHPNPRAQFSSDLSDLLLSFPDDHILIAGDINSWLGDANDDKNFSNLVLRHNLQDVLINKHGPASEIPTRKDGRRIDYIFASESVTQQVISCGALTYNRIVDSDHRALFIDLRIDELLEGSPPLLSSPALRGIDSKNPKLCVIYIEALTKYLGDHKVFSRTVKLETWTEEHGLTEGLKLLWEKLDRDVTAGCLHAERLARGRDRPPWSKDLHEAHLSVVYLKIAIRAMNKNTDSTEQLQAFLQHEADYTPPTVTTLPAALENLKLAKATLRAIQNNAKAFRETFLEERAAAAAAAKNITVEQAINAIIQRESTKRAFKTLRRYMRPDEFSPLTEVHIQKPDNSIEVVSEPSEMYSKIIERDLKHYNQAEGTPCTQNPVKQWLGASGTTPMCDSWLQGNAPPTVPSLAPETQAMLDNLRCNETPTPVDDRVTVDDYKEFFGKWDESTSTSQDRHLGHWKTLISHTAQNKYPEECDKIMHVLVKQMNLSLRHGYAWRRWKRIVCAKIPKRAGNMLLNKLRTIWLFEPDFNWLQGLVIGRRMIKAAETNKTLHDSQWGCRPGRHALGAVMLKVMSYEISRLTRSPLGSFDMDAASCFDRIIMALALLLCRREGVPSGTCIMAATVLMFAAFHIKTNHGVSYDWYSHSDDHPLHGPGQGSRIGPALWVLVSCLMFATMESLCHGAEFCNPSQTESHQRTGDGFVDDVANVFNCGLATMLSDDTITPEDISAGMQFEAQTWERLLWATGGALELSKCFYYILFYDFRKNGTPFLLAPNEMPGTPPHD